MPNIFYKLTHTDGLFVVHKIESLPLKTQSNYKKLSTRCKKYCLQIILCLNNVKNIVCYTKHIDFNTLLFNNNLRKSFKIMASLITNLSTMLYYVYFVFVYIVLVCPVSLLLYRVYARRKQ